MKQNDILLITVTKKFVNNTFLRNLFTGLESKVNNTMKGVQVLAYISLKL